MTKELKFRLSTDQRLLILAAIGLVIDETSAALLVGRPGSSEYREAERVLRVARSIQRGLG